MKPIKIGLRPTQIDFVSTAIAQFINKCPMRFSEPSIADEVLKIDPHDFLELINYIDKNFENELEIQRLKKMFLEAVPENFNKPLMDRL